MAETNILLPDSIKVLKALDKAPDHTLAYTALPKVKDIELVLFELRSHDYIEDTCNTLSHDCERDDGFEIHRFNATPTACAIKESGRLYLRHLSRSKATNARQTLGSWAKTLLSKVAKLLLPWVPLINLLILTSFL